jgi:hypothetical protein
VVEINTPQQMDAAGEYLLYDEKKKSLKKTIFIIFIIGENAVRPFDSLSGSG